MRLCFTTKLRDRMTGGELRMSGEREGWKGAEESSVQPAAELNGGQPSSKYKYSNVDK